MIFQYLANEAGLYPAESLRPASWFEESHLAPPPPTRARHQMTRSAIRKEAEKLMSSVPKLDIDYEDQLIDVKGSKYVSFANESDHSEDTYVTYFPESRRSKSDTPISHKTTTSRPLSSSTLNTSKRMSRKTLIDSLNHLNQRKKDAAQTRSQPTISNHMNQGWRSNSIGLDATQGFSGYLSTKSETIFLKPLKGGNEPTTPAVLNNFKRVGYVKSVSIPTSERKQSDFILKSKSYHHPTKQLHVRSEPISMSGFIGRGKFAGITCWKRGYGQDVYQ